MFKNIYSVEAIFRQSGAAFFSMKNITFQDCIVDGTELILIEGATEMIMENIYINNLTAPSDFTGDLIDIVRIIILIFRQPLQIQN